MSVIGAGNPSYDGIYTIDQVVKLSGSEYTSHEIKVAEVLNRDNQMLQDAYWMQCNRGTAYIYDKRAKLPKPEWREYNRGVGSDTTDLVRCVDYTGKLASRSQIDEEFIKNLDPAARDRLRWQRINPHITGIGNAIESAFFYGKNTEEIIVDNTVNVMVQGLDRLDSTRYENVYDAGGTGNNLTSIYLVQWGATGVSMLYPENGNGKMISHEDRGIHQVQDQDGKYYFAYVDVFEGNFGVCITNEKSVARICNIDLTAAAGAPGYLDVNLIRKAQTYLASDSSLRTVIYANKETVLDLEIKLADKPNTYFMPNNGGGFGTPVFVFYGTPIKKVDAIKLNETKVTSTAVAPVRKAEK